MTRERCHQALGGGEEFRERFGAAIESSFAAHGFEYPGAGSGVLCDEERRRAFQSVRRAAKRPGVFFSEGESDLFQETRTFLRENVDEAAKVRGISSDGGERCIPIDGRRNRTGFFFDLHNLAGDVEGSREGFEPIEQFLSTDRL